MGLRWRTKSGQLDIRNQRTWTHQQPTYRKGSHSPDYALASNAALASDFFGAPQFWHFECILPFYHGNMMIIIENPLELEVVWGSLFSFIFNQIQTEFDYAGSLMMPAAVGRLGTVHIDCNWKTMLWGLWNAIKKGREKMCVPVEWCNMMQCCCSAQLHGATCATMIRISQIRTWQELHVKTYQDTVFPLSSMISMSLMILAKHALFSY